MKIQKEKSGFTLVELLIVVMIISFVIVGMLLLYIRIGVLADMTGNKTIAINHAAGLIEEIRNETFDDVDDNYDNFSDQLTRAADGIDGAIYSYVTALNANLWEITVTVSFRNKYGRVVGEDANVDGNCSEDDGDGICESPITLVSWLAER